MSWELTPLTSLALALVIYWWFRGRPSNHHRVLYAAIACAALSVDGQGMMQRFYLVAHDAVFNASFEEQFSRLMLLGAITWYGPAPTPSCLEASLFA